MIRYPNRDGSASEHRSRHLGGDCLYPSLRTKSRRMATDDTDLFRRELRAWLAANLTDDLKRERVANLPEHERVPILRRWQAKLAADRWVAITWPKEYGGREA